MTVMLIGGYSAGKGQGSGISVLDGDEVSTVVSTESPSWIARHPALPVLYAVAETDAGRVHAWSLVAGAPADSLGSGETGGADPCHLVVDATGRYLITVNYTGGTICVHRLGADGSIGPRTDLVQHERGGAHARQDTAHPHMIAAIGDQLLVTDLGGDAIYRYRLSPDGKLQLDDIVSTPAQAGPRHLLAVGSNYYVTAELSGEVLAYDADWQFVGAVPASAGGGPNQPSELASNGTYLYVANRGPDTVSVFALDGGLPRYVTEVPTGTWPRHIAIAGDRLYVANERSHEVMVMAIDSATGVPALIKTIAVPSPTCVLS
jgi:6-phosphogluconolactonase